jgi:hypothetical protein
MFRLDSSDTLLSSLCVISSSPQLLESELVGHCNQLSGGTSSASCVVYDCKRGALVDWALRGVCAYSVCYDWTPQAF